MASEGVRTSSAGPGGVVSKAAIRPASSRAQPGEHLLFDAQPFEHRAGGGLGRVPHSVQRDHQPRERPFPRQPQHGHGSGADRSCPLARWRRVRAMMCHQPPLAGNGDLANVVPTSHGLRRICGGTNGPVPGKAAAFCGQVHALRIEALWHGDEDHRGSRTAAPSHASRRAVSAGPLRRPSPPATAWHTDTSSPPPSVPGSRLPGSG